MDFIKKQRNIILIYIHTFLSTFILYYICDTLFYIERGLTSSQYISFVGIAFGIRLLLEIPFGIIADKYNKKMLLLISNILFITSTIVFINSYIYYSFLVAIIINAMNNSLNSGIVNSILYESLSDKHKFKKLLFYNSFFYNVSYMIAMIIGGYIGQKFGLVNAVLFSGIKLMEESHPEYSANIGISVFIIGIYTSLILLFCIIGSYIGSKVNREKYQFVLNINPIISGICILLVGLLNNYIGIVFILLIYIFSESFENIMMSELHNNISSKSRVTVESINQFVLNLFGVIFSFLMTILLKFISISFMYIIIGVMIILFGILNLIARRKI